MTRGPGATARLVGLARRGALLVVAATLVVLTSAASAPPPPAAAEAPPAAAQSTADFEDARARMERAQRLFAERKFDEAVVEFSTAFERHKFTAFLFNAAVAAERGGKREQAVELYDKFLRLEPGAPDKVEVEKTIERLKKERAAQEAEPSGETQRADTRSLVLVESDPPGAPVTIYERIDPRAKALDPKSPDQVGYRKVMTGLVTPASLSLSLGTYFVLVHGFADYNPTGSSFTFEAGRAYVYRAGLSQGDFVGRVEIAMPIGTGKVWIDDPPPHKNAPRAVGPSSIELSPGEHTVYVEAVGFEPWSKTVTVEQGKTLSVEANLERVRYGYILVKGDAPVVEVEVDGLPAGVYKRRGVPLRVRVPAGEHRVEIDAEEMKTYEELLVVPPGQEITIDARFQEAPGRGGAILVTVLSVGALAGGIVMNRYADGLPDEDEVGDPNKEKEGFHYASIASLTAAGALAGLSVFLFIYDPSDDSTARIGGPREFTGELPADQQLGKRPKDALVRRPRGGVGLLWDGGSTAAWTGDGRPAPPFPSGLTIWGEL